MLIRRMEDRDVEPAVELALANYDGVMAEYHSAESIAGFRADVTPQSFRDQMALKQVFVAEEAGEVVATGAPADFGSAGAPKHTVSQFSVRSEFHGRGIGPRLLAHIAAAANSARADRLHVPSSRNAIGFYERAGFSVDSGQRGATREITWMTKPLRGHAEQGRRADRPRRHDERRREMGPQVTRLALCRARSRAQPKRTGRVGDGAGGPGA